MAEYQVKLNGSIVPYVGMYPSMVLYCLMLVMEDLHKAGEIDKLVSGTLDNKRYRDNISTLVAAKHDMVKQAEPHLFNATMDRIDSNGVACIRKIENLSPELMRNHFVRTMGDTALRQVLPGSSLVAGGWRKFERITELVQYTRTNGTSIMLLMRDDMRIISNGTEIGHMQYDDATVKRIVEQYCDMYSIVPNQLEEMSYKDVAMVMWQMKPSCATTYIEEKVNRLIHLLGKIEYRENKWEWFNKDHFCFYSPIDHGGALRCRVKVIDAWVAYLLMHDEAGTMPQFVKSLTSWCDHMYDIWNMDGYCEVYDDRIALRTEDGVVLDSKLVQMLKRYAADVACATTEYESVVVSLMRMLLEHGGSVKV